MLTARGIAGLPTGKHLDADGLYLVVSDTGSRSWAYRYRRGQRERIMALGPWPAISLATARQRHAAARAQLLGGTDPLDARRASQAAARPRGAPSFTEVAGAYITAHRAGWRGRTEGYWRGSLERASKAFGRKPVAAIGVEDLLKLLSPLWSSQAPTAIVLRARIERVLDYARARNWRHGENPARWRGNLQSLLAKPGRVHQVMHRAAVPWQEMPAVMVALRRHDSMGALCLQLVILTAVRSNEARGARWEEFDLNTKTWTIPASRMKVRKSHRVSLSAVAVELLEGLQALQSGPWVFAGQRPGTAIGSSAMRRVLSEAGWPDVTVHGMRSSFADFCADRGFPHDLIEQALAHQVGSAVARAYRRGDALDRRRELMQAWAEFLTTPPAVVVPLKRYAARATSP